MDLYSLYCASFGLIDSESRSIKFAKIALQIFNIKFITMDIVFVQIFANVKVHHLKIICRFISEIATNSSFCNAVELQMN